MTFTASAPAGALAKAFAMAARVSPRSSSAPILQNLLLKADSDRLRIVGASADATITVDVEGDASGAITAPADKLSAIAARLDPAKPLKLKLEGSQLVATQGRSRFTMPTMAPEQFAGTFADESSHSFDVSGDVLSAALKAVEGSTDDAAVSRLNMTGVYIDANGGEPLLVATNGRLLSVSPLKTTCPENMPGVIVHPSTFQIIHAMAGIVETLQIDVAPSSFAMSGAGVRYQAKVIDGQFPRWRAVVDRDSDRANFVSVDGDMMRAAMERVMAIGDSILQITFGKALEIEARNKKDAANGADEICDVVELSGDPIRAKFNSDDLAWALSSLPGASFYRFGLRNALDSVMVGDPARPDDIRLVMPLRG